MSCVAFPCEQVEVDVEVDVGLDVDCALEEIDFSAFVSDGCVSLVGSDVKVSVKILGDTGAFCIEPITNCEFCASFFSEFWH